MSNYTIDENGYQELNDEYWKAVKERSRKFNPLLTIMAWVFVLAFIIPWVTGIVCIIKSIAGGIL